MKHIIVQSISSIILYILMAFAIVSFASGVTQSMASFEAGVFKLEFNFLPFLLLIIFFIVWTVYSFQTRPNQKMSFGQWSVRMTEFSEVDEREALITAKATKAAYVSFNISVPLFMLTFFFYPVFQESWPTYPVFALASTLVIATLVYMTTWIRAYRQ
ncbi:MULTISPECIES: hypothetical protein [unclassified Exiguobacterium]|uniref:hypothetical protein n=1 Tax=unclassified Exiguobacterium TaxID=2644629 RepID=UPI001038C805|nr:MULTISPECIES: hypothetical protein [unclassified Exiguobacterium]TCI36428.1 hypothetical protein EVJ29_08065 [Exiguobacterium sp. SH4S7]TCI63376.1 hypothetical protein EVJ21_07690 [Exiguobacterium sp. SH0S2]TCI78086.1 hypothetical protein EVJ20_09055 [Exiguobacterium sp. SH0S1]